MKDDYKYCIFSSRNNYGPEPMFVTRSQADTSQGYASLYFVTEKDSLAIKQTGTTSQFKGSVWSERLWIDVDSYEQAETVEKKLKELEYDFVGYDSGGKGAHFGIKRNAFPSHLLPLQDKLWVKKNFKGCDTSIYTHLHLFRLPGTIHEKSGRPKVLVISQTGKELVHDKYETQRVSIDSIPHSPNPSSGSVFSNYEVMSKLGPIRVGNRHHTLVSSAYALKNHGMDVNAALWWLLEMNKDFEELKDYEEIQKILQDIYSST